MLSLMKIYKTVAGVRAINCIYVDPHLPPIDSSQILDYCHEKNINPSGTHIIEAMRSMHYDNNYRCLIDNNESLFREINEAYSHIRLPSTDDNPKHNAIVYVEQNIEILSDFIREFKIAEKYYNRLSTTNDPELEELEYSVLKTHARHKNEEGFLIEDAFVAIMRFHANCNNINWELCG